MQQWIINYQLKHNVVSELWNLWNELKSVWCWQTIPCVYDSFSKEVWPDRDSTVVLKECKDDLLCYSYVFQRRLHDLCTWGQILFYYCHYWWIATNLAIHRRSWDRFDLVLAAGQLMAIRPYNICIVYGLSFGRITPACIISDAWVYVMVQNKQNEHSRVRYCSVSSGWWYL